MQEKKDFFVDNDDHVMESFDQGTYAKQHPLFNSKELSFQLLFYYDGFEVVNPLGSKTNKHHMGNGILCFMVFVCSFCYVNFNIQYR